MFRLAGILGLCCLGIGLVLAGCSTTPRQNLAHVPDWADSGAPPAPAPQPSQPSFSPIPIAPPPVHSAPPAATVKFPGETWIPLTRWARANGLPTPERLVREPTPAYTLQSGNDLLLLHPGSQLARWDGLELYLGFAPQLIGGRPCLHALDLAKTILPLFDSAPLLEPNSNPIVVIDPGHGGMDSGTRDVLGRGYEKDYTLDWALRLQALLSARGWQALLTRSNDIDLPLSNRVAFAEQRNADLFLSLHFNSGGPTDGEAGLETYCLTPSGMPSNLTRGFADQTELLFPNNAFDAQNLRLALRVHRALLQVNGHHDRGIRHARFPAVLRGQSRPAVLIEGGFLSNPVEAKHIEDPAYRQKLASAVASALVN